jgi:hypothetical protein
VQWPAADAALAGSRIAIALEEARLRNTQIRAGKSPRCAGPLGGRTEVAAGADRRGPALRRRLDHAAMRRSRLLAMIVVAASIAPSQLAAAEEQACLAAAPYSWLDFWLGDWDVYVGERKVGENSIRSILGGCAVTEDWSGASGTHGHSLFYVSPEAATWRQVWITEHAVAPAGVKEKSLIERRADGTLIFQGAINDGARRYLDRTTLEPKAPGEVRQLIEVSTDDGRTWTPTFDAGYRRRR